MKMKKILLSICVGLMSSAFAYGQEEAPAMINTGVANFLTIPADARTAGMGGTGVAVTGGPMVFRNGAAALHETDRRGAATYTYAPWMRDRASGFALHSLGGSYRIHRRHAVLLGMRYFGYPKVVPVDENAAVVRPKELALEVGYAYALTKELAVSATVRYVYADMGKVGSNHATSTVVVDAGVMYRRSLANVEGGAWSVAATISQLGPKVTYLTGKESLPTLLRAGGAVEWPFHPAHRLLLTAEAGYRLAPSDVRALQVGAGVEYACWEYVRLRGGYHYGDRKKGDTPYATAGAGVAVRGVRADFAWLFGGSDCLARNTWWLSAGVAF